MSSTTSATRSEEQLQALGRAQAHVRSETSNSVDTIMATVSQTVCYIMPDVSKSELPIAVLTDRDEVRQYYSDERNFLEVVDASDLAEVSTDWYVFHEGLATTTEVRTGKQFSHTYAVLFPVAEDGIIGEILWPRQSLADLYAGKLLEDAERPRSHSEMLAIRQRHLKAHDSYLAAFTSGDLARVVDHWSADARVAVRHEGNGRSLVLEGTGHDAVGRRVATVLDGLVDPEIHVLSRLAGDWYVFADWIIRGRLRTDRGDSIGRRVELRCASIHPMTTESLIFGELAYGLDAVELAEEL